MQQGMVDRKNKAKWWEDLDFSYVTTATVVQFVKDNPRVQAIELSGSKNLTIDALDAIGCNCQGLVTLNASDCYIQGGEYTCAM